MQGMQGGAPRSRLLLPTSSVIVVALGVIGQLTLMQWTARTVLSHATIASRSLFPAALMSQRAGTAFQEMNREYRVAVELQEKTSLKSASRYAAAVGSSMDSAARYMEFNSSRHQQIDSLRGRIYGLQLRAKVDYAAAEDIRANQPKRLSADLSDLALQDKEVQTALETLQSDLEGDFNAELALIGGLLRMQGILGTALLASVMTALFFSTRGLIEAGARRRGVEVLHKAHKDSETLLNSVPSLLIVLDANGCIQQWNKAATMILGWQEAVVLGKTLDACGVKWLTTGISSRLAAYVQQPTGRGLDGVKLDRNGIVRFLGLRAIQLNTESATGTLIVGADITERMGLEEQLRQAQKLESIGQLAAGIAHEINTPTQYIGDNVQFLKGAFKDLRLVLENSDRLLVAAKGNVLSGEAVQEVSAALEDPEVCYLLDEIPKAIEQTLEGVARVSALVGAMKDFSHPGTKEKIELDLNRAIESTLTVASNEWKYVADVETDYDSSLPMVSCLPGEFNQAILILVVNAAHAIADVIGKGGPEKGKIKVQTRNCPEWDEVRIEDTGSGIPENIRARIFDPFFTTKEIGKGTGQGLAIARSVIVDKHGGTIHFETEEGKGTTFIIRLPRDGKTLTPQGALS
jgi:PAS domain S-box-containing protein